MKHTEVDKQEYDILHTLKDPLLNSQEQKAV